MYLVGADHPHKVDAQILLQRLIASGERLVTDAEVLQEILHRYVAINRRHAIPDAMNLLLTVVDEVYPISKGDVTRAADIVRGQTLFSARDALHIAVLEQHEVSSILSFDAGFDGWPGLSRIHQV